MIGSGSFDDPADRLVVSWRTEHAAPPATDPTPEDEGDVHPPPSPHAQDGPHGTLPSRD